MSSEDETKILNLHELEQIQNDIRANRLLIGSSDLLNRLNDDDSVFGRENIRGMQKNVFFINHHHSECSQRNLGDGKSKANPFEAEFAVRIAKYLTQQEYTSEQITILCTYVEQMFDVRNRMKNAFPQLAPKNPNDPSPKQIRVDVVDNYQGEECDIIILSMVRSNHPENKIGFLNISNRVCVALSRAKLGFYVLGNFDYLAKNCRGAQPDLWNNIRQSMLDQNALGPALPIVCKLHGEKQEISSAEQFLEKSPEGGCCRPCAGRLECGHKCDKMCHAYDADHSMGKCLKKCAKFCENELHQNCQLLCYEPCLPCTEIVEKVLECGHKILDECWKPIGMIACRTIVEKVLKCGHKTLDECWKPIGMIACRTTKKKCCHPNAGEKCLEKCTKFCRNGLHQNCQLLCYEYCLPCTEIIEKKLKCGHTTTGACWKPVELVPCKKKCSSILPCNHKCAGRCSAKCPPCLVQILKELPCGHQKMMECSKSVTAATKCRILVEKQWPICGHIVEVECHANPEKVPCSKPCVKTLNEDGENNKDQCHHPCKGTCGQCRNGRLHIECTEECKRIIGTKSSRILQNEWAMKKIEIVAWLKEWISNLPLWRTTIYSTIDSKRIEKISNLLANFPKMNVTARWMESTLPNIECILNSVKSGMEKVLTGPKNVNKWTKTLDEFKIDSNDVQKFLLNDLAELLERISECHAGGLHLISDATFNGLVSELRRNEFMLELFKFLNKVPMPPASQLSDFEQSVLEILQQIHADKPFTEIHAKMNDQLKMLGEKYGIPTARFF